MPDTRHRTPEPQRPKTKTKGIYDLRFTNNLKTDKDFNAGYQAPDTGHRIPEDQRPKTKPDTLTNYYNKISSRPFLS